MPTNTPALTPSHAAAEVVAALNWRYATKKFDPARKIPDATWSALEQAAILAPSSYGLQPWKFVVVNDPALRAKLREVSWNQPQITDASHLIVFCRRTGMVAADVHRYAERISQVRGVPVAAFQGYVDMMLGTVNKFPADSPQPEVWNSRQVYLALGCFLTAAAMMGIDVCPMEGFDGEKYDEMLKLKGTGYAATVIATAGYRAADDSMAGFKKVRFDRSDVVQHI